MMTPLHCPPNGCSPASLVHPLLVVLAGLLHSGCTELADEVETPDACLTDLDPTLEIGWGETTYNAIEDASQQVELIHGPQGGVHILVALQATGLAADSLITGQLLGLIDGVSVAQSFPLLDMRCNQQLGVQQSFGTLLEYHDDPVNLHGQVTEVTAEVTDTEETVVSASTTLTLVDPLLPQ